MLYSDCYRGVAYPVHGDAGGVRGAGGAGGDPVQTATQEQALCQLRVRRAGEREQLQPRQAQAGLRLLSHSSSRSMSHSPSYSQSSPSMLDVVISNKGQRQDT